MGGLLILFLVGLYLWIAYKVVRRVSPVWGKVLAIVVVVLIPTADAIYGRIKLKQMCAVEGGIKVYKTVEGVEGFYASQDFYETWIDKYGYRFVEGKNIDSSSPNKISRLGRNATGEVVSTTSNVKLSAYSIDFLSDDNGVYLQETDVIKNTQTGEVLAKSTRIIYFGGWIERSLSALYAGRWSADFCPNTDHFISLIEVVTTTLHPIK